MGALVGRSLFIEGLFARLVYRSLDKMHLAALHGSGAVLWRTFGWDGGQGREPTVKLH